MTASSRARSKRMRRQFFVTLFQQVRILWPVLSGILVVMVSSGAVIGRIESWRVGETLYFTFVTGLTIGYGDLAPKHILGRVLALVIGLSGIVLVGLIAAVSVRALDAADRESRAE